MSHASVTSTPNIKMNNSYSSFLSYHNLFDEKHTFDTRKIDKLSQTEDKHENGLATIYNSVNHPYASGHIFCR